MLFRIFILGLLFILAFQAIRNVLGTLLGRSRPAPPPKKSSLNLDESQIQDAEFQDLES